MSNLGPFRANQQPALPTPPRGDTIASYATYAEAQKAVDYLSDQHFPVQAVTIVGVGLQMVERVTGRLTYTRAALAGLGSGAWFGLMVGLLISLFGSAQGFSVIAAVVFGGAFGLLFGLISYALTGGRRDFTSISQIVASEYRVLCLPEQAGQAMRLLGELARGPGPGAGPTGGAGAPVTPVPAREEMPWSSPSPSSPSPSPSPSPAPAPGAESEPAGSLSGPTYGEMIDRQRAERAQKSRQPDGAGTGSDEG